MTRDEIYNNTIEQLEEMDQDFVLWYLLQNFIDETTKERDKVRNADTIKDYVYCNYLERIINTAEEMRTLLGYKLWNG